MTTTDLSLHVKPEDEAAQRRVKSINGHVLLAMYVVPGMPMFDRIGLFHLTSAGPAFIQYIHAEHWEDDLFLEYTIHRFLNNH